jgi:tRNA-splicing ligase RtcB
MSELVNQMENIITPPLNNLLDESPDAYKDITEVIAAQEGILIEVVDHFRPVLVVKG